MSGESVTFSSATAAADGGTLTIVYALASHVWSAPALVKPAGGITVALTRAGQAHTLVALDAALVVGGEMGEALTATCALSGPIFASDTSVSVSLPVATIVDASGNQNAAQSGAAVVNGSTLTTRLSAGRLDSDRLSESRLAKGRL